MKHEFMVVILISFLSLSNGISQSGDYIQDFIRTNPDKVAFYFTKDDSISFGLNEKKSMPVASLSKTLVALEFAFQEKNGELDANEMVALSEIDRFAIGDENHKNWKKQIRKDKLIQNQKVALKYIAQGMIRFSANSCADFLLNRLGIDRVNERITALSLEHEPIFPFTASLLLAFNYEGDEKTKFLSEASLWSREDYRSKVLNLHHQILESDNFLKRIKRKIGKSSYQDVDYDALWSNFFSYSNAEEYVNIIRRINERSFGPKMDEMLKFIFESWALEENSHLKSEYEGISYKGAGTNSLINVWLYLRTKDGIKTHFAGFFNNLTKKEFTEIEKSISNFGFRLSTDEDFMKLWQGEK